MQICFFVASPTQGCNIIVGDLFSAQQIGNALGWGLVDDTPNSFVWEIGRTSVFTSPAGKFCVPGQASCASYDIPHWLGLAPLRIVPVTFADGSQPKQWAVVSDLGAAAEVNSFCPSYGGPYCSYPRYACNSGASALTYGGHYPGTQFDYGGAQGSQFATTPLCGGPFGPDSMFCDTVLTPPPPLR